MTEPFVRTTDDGVVELVGDLDAHSAPWLEDFLEQRRRAEGSSAPSTLVIDLSKVAFVDSSGLRSLVLARQMSASLVIRGANRAARRLFALTGLETEFEIER